MKDFNKWEKLKQAIKNEIENDKEQYEYTNASCFRDYISCCMWVLSTMGSLENLEEDLKGF